MNLNSIQTQASKHGLIIRGSFYPQPQDQIPQFAIGRPAKTLLLFGNLGMSIWPHFSASNEYKDKQADPLDRWSKRVGDMLAKKWRAQAYYPFDGPPFKPFIKWAIRAENLQPSKLGMLMHPKHGLWHAYRFAIALPQKIEFPAIKPHVHACDNCTQKPCLTTCPVNAFSGDHYDVKTCYQYLAQNPTASCHSQGCQARHACPEGKTSHYEPDQAAFHMEKFYKSLQDRFMAKASQRS